MHSPFSEIPESDVCRLMVLPEMRWNSTMITILLCLAGPDTWSWSWSCYCHMHRPHTGCHSSAYCKPQSPEKILPKLTFEAANHLSELSGITPTVWVQLFHEWDVSRLDLGLVRRGWETKPSMVPTWVKAPARLEGLGTFSWGNRHMFTEVMQVCALLGAKFLPTRL